MIESSASKAELGAPIVTEITKFKEFYPAEKYHQNYYKLNGSQSYCQFVIRPKVEKFNIDGSKVEAAPPKAPPAAASPKAAPATPAPAPASPATPPAAHPAAPAK